MPDTNYAAHVSDMLSAANAMDIVIERMWDKERDGEAFVLEKVRDTMNAGAAAMDELIYACKKQNK